MPQERLGVYIPSHNQPVFLRLALLQLLAQTRLPDAISFYENGHGVDYSHWVAEDIIEQLVRRGVQVLHTASKEKVDAPRYFIEPLRHLVKHSDCTLFTKLDPDDIIYADHLERLVANIYHLDWSGNRNTQLLVLPREGNYRYNRFVEMGKFNPIGAHPGTVVFRRNVAEAFLLEMLNSPGGTPDDVVFAARIIPNPAFKGHVFNLAPSMCYVSHGKNISTAHWADCPPPEAL